MNIDDRDTSLCVFWTLDPTYIFCLEFNSHLNPPRIKGVVTISEMFPLQIVGGI